MQLGLYSFGATPPTAASGRWSATAQVTRDLLEAIVLADQVGLDYFGIGEHHLEMLPASAGATLLAGAATQTSRILLGSAVTVLSTDDPIRVFEQFATLDALSDGRAEITAGRGSTGESFPLFGYDVQDYDALYAQKIDLLLQINRDEYRSAGPRGPMQPAVVPRPDRGHLPIWIGTGGSPASSARAGQLGLPVSYGIIGGDPHRFAKLAELYRKAHDYAGHDPSRTRVSVGNPGLVGPTRAAARETYWDGWHSSRGQRIGSPFAPSDRRQLDAQAERGSLFVGEPEQVAERILALHSSVGHMRQFFQTDFSPVPQRDVLRSIELLGTKVKPIVDAELGPEPADLRDTVTGEAQPALIPSSEGRTP